MIIYGLLNAFDFILSLVINLIPVIGVPAFMSASVISAFNVIFTFNMYLPISEIFTVFLYIISFHLQYKIICVILGKFGIDLNK